MFLVHQTNEMLLMMTSSTQNMLNVVCVRGACVLEQTHCFDKCLEIFVEELVSLSAVPVLMNSSMLHT